MGYTLENAIDNSDATKVYENFMVYADNKAYTSATYEFPSRQKARDFCRRAAKFSLYSPSFCDIFKRARVTIYLDGDQTEA